MNRYGHAECMEHLLEHENVGRFLATVLDSRKAMDPSYSLRSFARDLDVAPSTLCEVISGRKGLSAPMAEKLITKLRLGEEESQFFRLLADPDVRRSESKIENAKRALQIVRNRKALSLEIFQMVSGWYHFALLEGLKKSEWRKDLHTVASKLGLSMEAVLVALKRLRRLGLISVDNVPMTGQVATVQEGSGQAHQAHHRQLLMRAAQHLESSPLHALDFQTTHMIFDSQRLPELRQRLQAFQAEIYRDFGNATEASDQIRCLAIQFFPVSQVGDTEDSKTGAGGFR